MASDKEIFNAHQEDVRRRADSLARSIFVLAGGTLTVSISIFTKDSAPSLPEKLAWVLKASWWSLFASIIFFVLTLTIIIARDYAFGESWRKKINGQSADVAGGRAGVEILIWALALLGLFGFLGGIIGQAYVASGVL